MRIKFIKAPATWPLRHKVLRPHQELEDCDYPNDRNKDSFHLGAYDGDELIGVASFYGERNEQIVAWKQYRLRGMATLQRYQGRGIGRKLLQFGLDHLQANGADVLWCNARVVAGSFYRQMKFDALGEQFELEGIGPHQLMFYLFRG